MASHGPNHLSLSLSTSRCFIFPFTLDPMSITALSGKADITLMPRFAKLELNSVFLILEIDFSICSVYIAEHSNVLQERSSFEPMVHDWEEQVNRRCGGFWRERYS